MKDPLIALLEQIKQLEAELIGEARKKETEFCYQIHAKKVQFTAAAKIGGKRLQVSWHRYLLNSRFLVLATAPLIWLCAIPIALADLVGSVYQAICFPIYGIPKVHRRDYLAFDRHRLTYLNFVEKLNCEYCAYVNGILAYFTEIAARTGEVPAADRENSPGLPGHREVAIRRGGLTAEGRCGRPAEAGQSKGGYKATSLRNFLSEIAPGLQFPVAPDFARVRACKPHPLVSWRRPTRRGSITI